MAKARVPGVPANPVKGAGPRPGNGQQSEPRVRASKGGLPHAGLRSEWKARPEAEEIGPEGGFDARNLWNESKPTKQEA